VEFRAGEWGRQGTTLREKTACLEYGLTQEEIFVAIDAGELQCRPAAMHRDPWLRLLRREVDDLARDRSDDRCFRERQEQTELAQVKRELKQLRAQLATLGKARGASASAPC
jgi:hypothetical protein